MSERLPVEDPDAGLYVHRPRPGMKGTRVLVVDDESERAYWVAVEDFMVVQRERDEFRKTLGVINSMKRVRELPAVARMLDQAGFTAEHGKTMRSVIHGVLDDMERES